jgi:hypothetical protein
LLAQATASSQTCAGGDVQDSDGSAAEPHAPHPCGHARQAGDRDGGPARPSAPLTHARHGSDIDELADAGDAATAPPRATAAPEREATYPTGRRRREKLR